MSTHIVEETEQVFMDKVTGELNVENWGHGKPSKQRNAVAWSFNGLWAPLNLRIFWLHISTRGHFL